jgi:hypothetical protein
MTSNPLIVNASQLKNWALVSDMMRVDILNKYGGIYLDTDVELFKSFDELLHYELFMGYEDKHWLNNAIIGSQAQSPILNEVISIYTQDANVIKYSNFISVHAFSTIFRYYFGIKNNGKTKIIDDKIALLNMEYLYAKDWLTHKVNITPNTISIHHGSRSWFSAKQKHWVNVLQLLNLIGGRAIFNAIEGVVIKKFYRLCKRRINIRKKPKLNTLSIGS